MARRKDSPPKAALLDEQFFSLAELNRARLMPGEAHKPYLGKRTVLCFYASAYPFEGKYYMSLVNCKVFSKKRL